MKKMDDPTRDRSLLEEARMYARQLEEVNAIGRELSSMLELEPLLQRILSAAIKLTNTEEGALFLVEEADQSLVFRVVNGGPQNLVGMRLPAGTGIVGRVAATGEPQIINDAQQNPFWSDLVDVSRNHTTRSILAAPLLKNGKSIGVLEVINRLDGQPFHQQDLTGLAALASQAVVAMETARLHQAEITKERMERELQLGHRMQASLIPANVPALAGWEFSAWWKPAREVSGDFYDFVWLEDNLGLVLADVSDKGVHAALFMALTRSTVRGALDAGVRPAASIAKANHLIAQDAKSGMFVTLFYAQFRPDSGDVYYVNAGHCPTIWYQEERQEIVTLNPTGIALGFDLGIPIKQKVIKCAPGDILLFYTDGISEAMNAEKSQFGEDRLWKILRKYSHLPCHEFMERLQQSLLEFTGNTPQYDDITLVIARRKSI